MIESAIAWLLHVLAAPEVGLTSVFLISFVSATLVPLGSEPAVFAVIKANPGLFWSAIGVATVGNTLGGAVDYYIGYQAKQTFARLPGIGDPLCTLGGWLKLPFWPSLAYMAVGKLLRYLTMTTLLLYVPDGVWHRIGQMLG